MRHLENDATDNLSNFSKELKLLRERIEFLEASVFGGTQNPVLSNPVGHEQSHITVQSQQGAIAIAIRSPSKASTPSTLSQASACISRSDAAPSSPRPAIFGNPSPSPTPIPKAPLPAPILTAPSLTPNPFVPPETSSWGLMMTPKEVQELLAPEPQTGEFYVVIKGRRPGIYLFWPEAHEVVDGLKSACYWKRTDKDTALGQYTISYKKGACEYRFQ